MSGGLRRQPFCLDSPGDKGNGKLGGLADEVSSGLGGLTIVSAPGDTSWLGVGGLPAQPPQSAPNSSYLALARTVWHWGRVIWSRTVASK